MQREHLRLDVGHAARSRSDTPIIVRNAIGTETIAGCCSSASAPPVGSPSARPTKIAEVATSIPAHIPTAAPRAVSRDHQMPSRNIGQKELAASAKAQPTRIAMSTPCATSATSVGITIAPSAASRKWSRRIAPPEGTVWRTRGQTSWLKVPASETSRPLEVERKAAKAPAQVTAVRIVPPVPGQAIRGSDSTTSSVCPVM